MKLGLPKAVEALIDLVENGSEPARLKAAEMILDRCLGRNNDLSMEHNNKSILIDKDPLEVIKTVKAALQIFEAETGVKNE